jgi:hypothetical protein
MLGCLLAMMVFQLCKALLEHLKLDSDFKKIEFHPGVG